MCYCPVATLYYQTFVIMRRRARQTRVLAVHSSNLRDLHAAHLAKVKSLRRLDIWGHHYPAYCLENLSHIVKLVCYDCSITGNPLQHLPNLQHLCLDKVKITQASLQGISASVAGLTGLKTLKLLNTSPVEALAAGLGDLSSLQQLAVPDSNLTLQHLAGLSKLTALTHLDLEDNDLSSIPGGSSFGATLQHLTNLQYLDVRHCNLAYLHQVTALANLESLLVAGNVLADIQFASALRGPEVMDLQPRQIPAAVQQAPHGNGQAVAANSPAPAAPQPPAAPGIAPAVNPQPAAPQPEIAQHQAAPALYAYSQAFAKELGTGSIAGIVTNGALVVVLHNDLSVLCLCIATAGQLP